ncbi:ATP-binding protein [Halosquirtibacter xylanolyticus]|uniref:AAA family ATPase n=1 Tax=Halosquirtibacter xylanolyticus TaxID=3374599 RepID=UPI0037482D2B|nr:ATP-binding protein [Prolixibacteraceae bacterium]
MKKIGFKNLRSLKNIEGIEICPLTVIVGKNSSGKSTFLRSFPLLKQSLDTKTNSPILWYDPSFVDFGSYAECINKHASSNDDIVFLYEFKLDRKNDRGFLFFNNRFVDIDANILLKLHIKIEDKKEFVNLIEIKIDESLIVIDINYDYGVNSIVINDREFSQNNEFKTISLSINKILPLLTLSKKERINFYGSEYEPSLFKILEKLTKSGTKKETHVSMLNNFELGGYETFYSSLRSDKKSPKSWHTSLEKLDKEDSILKELHNLYLLSNINKILESCDHYLTRYYEHVYYVAPVRATAERYYRQQGLAVNRIDPRGINLPMFLESLSKKEFVKFQEWTRTNLKFEPVVSTVGGHLSISLKINELEINLADTGFGFSQILPIVTQLWAITRKRKMPKQLNRSMGPITFVIEQPELHLHPRLQALLIDTFVKVINTSKKESIEVKIIFETHSETMVNRLGHHVANGNISNELINISIFDSEGFETTIKNGKYDSKGRLTNWPIGFFYPDIIG